MHNLTATQIRDQFAKGELSAKATVEGYLERIQKHDATVGAFLNVLNERALEKAHELDQRRSKGEKLGKLAGVPIAIKDNMNIRGVVTTCGSKFLTNYLAPFNATAIEHLEAEDAILIGKTNLDEFAMGSTNEHSALKKTVNPWNLKCVAGGSSGGSAVAVAARMSPLALGSDTGGSVRLPACLCGVVGYKPTYGRVSRYGLVAFGSSLDQIGPFANSCADIGLVMEVMGSYCKRDATSLPLKNQSYPMDGNLSGVKVGVPRTVIGELEGEAQKNFNWSLSVMKERGAEIIDVELKMIKHVVAVYYILATAEASTNLSRFDGIRYGQRSREAQTLSQIYDFSRDFGFGAEVKRRILLGTYVLSAGYQDSYYKQAQKVRTLMVQEYKRALESCNVIAMPVSPFPAFEMGSIRDPLQEYLLDLYTISANLIGCPAISIPSGFTQDGKPLGLQLMGAHKEDPFLVGIAHAFEQAANIEKKIPESVA